MKIQSINCILSSLAFLLICNLSPAEAASSPLMSLKQIEERNEELPDYKKLKSKFNNLKEPMLWLFIGDSITHGCKHTNNQRNFPEHCSEFIRWEAHQTKRKTDFVFNLGVSGETAPGFLKDANWRLTPYKPDVVLINFGTNDARSKKNVDDFKKDLKTIISKTRKKKAIPVLQVPNTTRNVLPKDKVYHNAIREVADETKCLLVDHAARWSELNNDLYKAPNKWTNDNLHPNAAGHALMAQTILFSLGLDKANVKGSVLRIAIP